MTGVAQSIPGTTRPFAAALLAVTLAMTLLAGLPGAAGACSLAIMDVGSTTWSGKHGAGYEVFDPQRYAHAVNFRVRGRDGACPFFVTVAPAITVDGVTGELRGPGDPLRFELHKDASAARPLKPLAIAGPGDVFADVSAGDDGTRAFQFAIILPPQQVVAPGGYSGDIEVAAYEGQVGSAILRDRRRLPVSVSVPSVAQLSFSEGAGFDPNYGSYTVNFNDLRPGKRRTVSLKARSNGGYRITLESLNGALRHLDASDGSAVSYSVTIDGAPLSLPRAVPTPAILNAQATGPGGRQHLLEFTVGEIGDASPGDYRDVVSLEVLSLR